MAGTQDVCWIILCLFPIINGQFSAKRYIKFLEEPNDVMVVRNRPAELRCNVTGESGINISWLKNGQPLDLTGDKRRTISPEGSLKFSNILRQKKLPLDEKKALPDDGAYQCVALLQKDGHKFKLVSREATLTIAGMSKTFNKLPSNLTVHQGETAYFQCKIKRSRPAAKITWSLAGKNTDLTLNFRFVVLPSGVLEIRSVMTSDSGVYVCKATNKIMKRSVIATASLLVKPASTVPKATKFLIKPRDTTILHNENLIVECVVTGYPRKPVSWLKDGSQLSLSGRYSKYGTDNLKVETVQPGDSGKYECVVGSLRAAAMVQVIVPPQITAKPQDIAKMEYSDIKMTCIASGHPQPKLTWYYNGDTTGDIGYIVITNTTMSISDIMDTDEGMYQCFAENEGGMVQAAAQLTVIMEEDLTTTPPATTTPLPTTTTPKPTTLPPPTSKGAAPAAPNNVKANALGTSSVLVSWDPPGPKGVIINYTVVATAAGQVTRMPTTSQTSITLRNLHPDTLYNFAVFAVNQYGKGQISKYAKAKTQSVPVLPESRTGPPRDVIAKAIDSTAIKVSWKEPSFIASPIQNYTIHYQDAAKKNPVRYKTSLKLEVVLLKLHPYTLYNIYVTATTSSGLGKNSGVVTERTKSGIPKDPPKDIKLTEMGGMLVAEWHPPSNPNGNITSYELRLKNVNTGQVETATTHETQKMFPKVQRSTTYAFRVAAVTEMGRGVFSKWEKIAMSPKALTEDVVPGPPTNLKTRLIQGMVKVTWDPPAESHIVLRKYVLDYGRGAPGQHDIDISNTTTSYFLSDLKPGLFYIIRVKAANNKGHGKEAMERVDVPFDAPGPKIGLFDLKAVPVKNKSLTLSWKDTLQITHGVIYNIKYTVNAKWIYVNASTQSYVVENLLPGRIYTFYIKRDNQKSYPKEQIVKNWTREEVPSVPKDVTVKYEAEQGYVRIQWNSPDHRNGLISNYKICWKLKSAPQNWVCTTVKGYELNERISGISDNETYLVKVRAKNKAGEGLFSEVKTFLGRNVRFLNVRVTSTTSSVTESVDFISREKKEEGGGKGGLGEKTLWIVIAVIGAVTFIAIVVISVVLCKKNSRGDSLPGYKPKKSDPYKAVANGAAKKKGTKENYWIKQNSMEMEPYKRKENSSMNSIPRNAEEMRPLDSPFQSRKNQNSLLNEGDSDDEIGSINGTGSSFAGDNTLGLPADYFKPASSPPINIYNSPFPQELEEFPEPPPEIMEDKFDDGPATSSDYGSEELVTPPADQTPVSYMPAGKPANGYVSVATDYDYPPKDRTNDVPDASALQNLMRDLDAIMAKEDRV